MRWIARRGNRRGACPERENRPEYLHEAIAEGFDVEVDVWLDDDGVTWRLGRDAPEHEVDKSFLLRTDRVWCHARSMRALEGLLAIGAHVFCHESDPVVLTSLGVPWAYPGCCEAGAMNGGVCVMPELLWAREDEATCEASASAPLPSLWTEFSASERWRRSRSGASCSGVCSDVVAWLREGETHVGT